MKIKRDSGGRAPRRGHRGDLWRNTFLRLGANKVSVICLAIFLLICLSCLFAPLLTDYEYWAINAKDRLAKPSLEHLLGTDNLGRDTFTRILYGGRVTLRITFSSAVLALTAGSLIGLLAGYFGGKTDYVISPILDILAAVPVILLALVFEGLTHWGNGNFMYALTIALIPQFARLVRITVIDIMGREYIEAVRALGVSSAGVIFRHIAHNAAPVLIVRFTSALAETLLTCTILGYLSIGIGPPTPEWGNIVFLSKNYMRHSPLLMIIPCAVISLTVISISLFGDGLHDAMDPKAELPVKRSLTSKLFRSGKRRAAPTEY